MSQKQYPLRYETGTVVDEWLQNQQNKRESLTLLISAFANEFGMLDMREVAAQGITLAAANDQVEMLDKQTTREHDHHNVQPMSDLKIENNSSENMLGMLSSL